MLDKQASEQIVSLKEHLPCRGEVGESYANLYPLLFTVRYLALAVSQRSRRGEGTEPACCPKSRDSIFTIPFFKVQACGEARLFVATMDGQALELLSAPERGQRWNPQANQVLELPPAPETCQGVRARQLLPRM
jgi:hypothetical protein